MSEPVRLAILISGRGSNMQALVAACARGDIAASVALVLADRAGAAGIDWARGKGLPSATVERRGHPDRPHFEAALAAAVDAARADYLLLAGFMRLLSAEFVDRHPGRILNIHPSLLPAYRGLDTHHRALAAGEPVVGATVHFVDAGLDTGPAVAQWRVPVAADDDAQSLAARVLRAEHRLYPRVVALLAAGRLRWRDGVLTLDGAPLTEPLQLTGCSSGPEQKCSEQ